MREIPKSYEIVGDIALVEIPPFSKREEIASLIMQEHKNVKIVAEKKRRVGEFRTKEIEFIVGKRSTTLHREAGCKILLDIASCYFSEREKGERWRISGIVEEGEEIFVPFAGVGAFPLLIASRREVKIKAVELNPSAFRFLSHNIRLNRLQERIEAIFADAYSVDYEKTFDRIVIPQPYRHNSFQTFAPLCKRGGFIHYYTWLGREDMQPLFPGFRILEARKISSYAPHVWKWCFDLRRL